MRSRTTPGNCSPVDKLDAYRCGKVLVDARGGQEAWRHAVARAVELKEGGDEAGHFAWVAIVAAVETLTRTERRDSERLQ